MIKSEADAFMPSRHLVFLLKNIFKKSRTQKFYVEYIKYENK